MSEVTDDQRRIAMYLGLNQDHSEYWPIEKLNKLIALEKYRGVTALHDEIDKMIRAPSRDLQQEILEEFKKVSNNQASADDFPKLRDQFAMAALTGLLCGSARMILDEKIIARQAYIMADAMLAERSK